MSAADPPWTIVGQGLAGTCLAWAFWKRGTPFRILDREKGGSSRVAAGMINPVTGKNFQPSTRIDEFHPEAVGFYQHLATELGQSFWHPLPILRLASSDKEWRKITSKTSLPEVARWLAGSGEPIAVPGWHGAIEVTGGGRLDTRAFLDASRAFFLEHGTYQASEAPAAPAAGNRIWCEGAAGLMTGRYGPHRCAKGEILTVSAPSWDARYIRIGAGGWLVPIGNDSFKVGSTYQWDQLDESPTESGRQRVCEIASRLGGPGFEILAHDAGIRPILRRSEPLVGPLGDGDWMFNALGSKGSLYAPGIARRLADWLIDGTEPDPYFDYREFRKTS